MINFFTNAQKGLNKPILYLAGIFLAFLGYFVGQLPFVLVTQWSIRAQKIGSEGYNRFLQTMDFSAIGLHPNLGFVLLILMFVFALGGVLIAVRIHKKKPMDLIKPFGKIDWYKILYGFGLWFAVGSVLEIVMYLMNPEDYVMIFKPGSFIVLLLICVVLLPIQTTFEEYFFRGYIMQGMANFSKRKWVPLVISTLFFALVHSSNPEVGEYGLLPMLIYYIAAGLFLGIITIVDDSLELALGVHWATNFFGSLILSYEGSVLQMDSIFKSGKVNTWVMTLFFIVSAGIFIYFASRKYKWGNKLSIAYITGQINFGPDSSPSFVSTHTQPDTNYTNLLNDDNETIVDETNP